MVYCLCIIFVLVTYCFRVLTPSRFQSIFVFLIPEVVPKIVPHYLSYQKSEHSLGTRLTQTDFHILSISVLPDVFDLPDMKNGRKHLPYSVYKNAIKSLLRSNYPNISLTLTLKINNTDFLHQVHNVTDISIRLWGSRGTKYS